MHEELSPKKLSPAVGAESEGVYRDLFESSRDALMIAEPPSGMITSLNLAAVKMFGAKNKEELLSRMPGELSPERQPDGRDSAEKAREMIETAIRDGSHFFEWTHRRITGEEFPAEVLLTRMERDGKVFHQATVRDITERKQAEDALNKGFIYNVTLIPPYFRDGLCRFGEAVNPETRFFSSGDGVTMVNMNEQCAAGIRSARSSSSCVRMTILSRSPSPGCISRTSMSPNGVEQSTLTSCFALVASAFASRAKTSSIHLYVSKTACETSWP